MTTSTHPLQQQGMPQLLFDLFEYSEALDELNEAMRQNKTTPVPFLWTAMSLLDEKSDLSTMSSKSTNHKNKIQFV